MATSSRTWHLDQLIAATIRQSKVRYNDSARPAPQYTEHEPGVSAHRRMPSRRN